jgi:hypothetical protein
VLGYAQDRAAGISHQQQARALFTEIGASEADHRRSVLGMDSD